MRTSRLFDLGRIAWCCLNILGLASCTTELAPSDFGNADLCFDKSLRTTPPKLDFGSNQALMTAYTSVVIQNTAGCAKTILMATADSGDGGRGAGANFVPPPHLPIMFAAHTSVSLTFDYIFTIGPSDGIFRLTVNDGSEVDIPFTGHGYD